MPIEGTYVHYFEWSDTAQFNIKNVGFTITNKEGIATYKDGLFELSFASKDYLPAEYMIQGSSNVQVIHEPKFNGLVLLLFPGFLIKLEDLKFRPNYIGQGFKLDFYQMKEPSSPLVHSYRGGPYYEEGWLKTWAIKNTWLQISTYYIKPDHTATTDQIITDKIYMDAEKTIKVP